MTTRLTTLEARAFLGGIGRSTLWLWYADCRVAITASKRPKVAWDRDKLDKRQQQLARQSIGWLDSTRRPDRARAVRVGAGE